MSESHSEYADENPERILTQKEIMAAINTHATNHTPVRELSDDKGIYLLEVKVEGEKPGDFIEYTYQRKGVFERSNTSAPIGHNVSPVTVIRATYYEDHMPYAGGAVSQYNEETGEWIEAPKN